MLCHPRISRQELPLWLLTLASTCSCTYLGFIGDTAQTRMFLFLSNHLRNPRQASNCPLPYACSCTCIGYYGQCSSNKIVSSCVPTPKKPKGSIATVAFMFIFESCYFSQLGILEQWGTNMIVSSMLCHPRISRQELPLWLLTLAFTCKCTYLGFICDAAQIRMFLVCVVSPKESKASKQLSFALCTQLHLHWLLWTR